MIDVASVARKHDAEIRAFRRRLFTTEAGAVSPGVAGSAAAEPRLRPLGPVKSLTDRHAELTIVGDMTDQAELLEDPARKGAVMTLSVAAHHRQLHSRLRVDAEEADAWITAILGDEWASSVYAAGALSTVSAGLRPALTTQYFYVFIDEEGKPEPAPESFHLALQPLR